jgi:hypothetical protein
MMKEIKTQAHKERQKTHRVVVYDEKCREYMLKETEMIRRTETQIDKLRYKEEKMESGCWLCLMKNVGRSRL